MIVGEATTNYVNGTCQSEPVGRKFERMIEHNRARGYALHSWHYAQSHGADLEWASDTIVAVFVRDPVLPVG